MREWAKVKKKKFNLNTLGLNENIILRFGPSRDSTFEGWQYSDQQ